MSMTRGGANRRDVLVAGAGVAALPVAAQAKAGKGAGQEKETPAVEDLMREHGVLRRALLVYSELAMRIRSGRGRFDARPLHRAALLFRNFGEEYHEKKLEEAHIFPVVRKAGGPAAGYVDVLSAQHARGREITDFVLSVTNGGSVPSGRTESLAAWLEQFVRMYQNHAAREDTIVFPAWKTALSQKRIEELGDLFEDIEKKQFGHDGFEDAVRQMAAIEAAYGLTDLRQFTALPPPHV